MNFYTIIKQLHSGFRYIVFILILIAIIQSLAGWLGEKNYTEGNRKLNLFALISAHTQLLIGIVLLFISPYVKFSGESMKDDTLRYFTAEHWVGMIIAIVLITIGHSKSKKALTAEAKHKTIAIFYIIAFIVIIAVILAGHLPVVGSRA